MTGMDKYEKLKELYEHMMVVRKDSRQHIQELCVALDNGLWFPERQQQAVRDDLQALSQAQDALCQALAQVQIATADKADELGERIEAWHREQENREAMKAMVHQLEGIFDVAYVGTDESIASQFRQMQGDVKALLGLSLTFDELSARAEKYIRFQDRLAEKLALRRFLEKKVQTIEKPSTSTDPSWTGTWPIPCAASSAAISAWPASIMISA